MCVSQSQNVPLSCLGQLLADRLAEAAYRDILGLSYARAFPQLGVLLTVRRVMCDQKMSPYIVDRFSLQYNTEHRRGC